MNVRYERDFQTISHTRRTCTRTTPLPTPSGSLRPVIIISLDFFWNFHGNFSGFFLVFLAKQTKTWFFTRVMLLIGSCDENTLSAFLIGKPPAIDLSVEFHR
jgi:hypothetical protein